MTYVNYMHIHNERNILDDVNNVRTYVHSVFVNKNNKIAFSPVIIYADINVLRGFTGNVRGIVSFLGKFRQTYTVTYRRRGITSIVKRHFRKTKSEGCVGFRLVLGLNIAMWKSSLVESFQRRPREREGVWSMMGISMRILFLGETILKVSSILYINFVYVYFNHTIHRASATHDPVTEWFIWQFQVTHLSHYSLRLGFWSNNT